jgi:hypothetical protein
MNLLIFFVSILFITAVAYLVVRGRRNGQVAYIKGYKFHHAIKKKLQARYPHLTEEQLHLVFRGLRDYFFMCNRAGSNMVAMPSQVVDDAWHEFILFTRAYRRFCRKALGRFLHHTPAEAMSTPTLATAGIKRAWRLACARERIDPANPNRLPLIFAIDAMLDIPNGFTYSLDCKDKNSPTHGSGYCASHIGCSGGCAGDSGAATTESGDAGDGFFDGFFDSDGSGCGGGCGGD